MRMKFKSTTLNPRALVYKRFISIEKSFNTNTLYKTTDNIFWAFDVDALTFMPIDTELVPESATTIQVLNSTYLQFKDTYFWYATSSSGNEWKSTKEIGENISPLNLTFNNVGKYQTNKYYFVGSIDYMIKGGIEGSTTQYIKGNIIPLTSFNIRYFSDDIKLSPDDLIVIDNHLFSVENVEEVIKRQPKKFSVYFATLNSIL